MLLICQYIDSRKEEFGVEPICQALTSADVKIAPSTYYAAKSRPRSARSRRDEALKAEIKKVQENNYCVLDARKMHAMLNRPEVCERHGLGHVARCTVERLMRAMGLQGIRRATAPRTTRSALKKRCPADLVNRHFSAFRPNELWECGHHLRTNPVRLGLCGLRPLTSTRVGSSAGRPPRARTLTWPWTL
ncbi:hypothetical protein DDD63_00250 [Actinobaculum sp. 313]|nr:hypothetical protein DDD63_00250 [Actinobaculum sp. 313]